tara:strand:- start:1424 stop:1702 length:279 start_codon:yes stop_codon:yes gene_type:complete
MKRKSRRLRRFENVFADCMDCACCYVHSLDRPRELAPWVEVDEVAKRRTTPSNKGADDRPKCKCPCRHNAREICRKIFGVHFSDKRGRDPCA